MRLTHFSFVIILNFGKIIIGKKNYSIKNFLLTEI